MNFIKYIKLILGIAVFTSGIYAAEVTLNVTYGKTGSLAGDLNSVGDMVNGRNICPNVNTYANGTPGCDMSHDAGLNDNGTPNDFTDDHYEGDLIVRTNDSFEVISAFGWTGTAGGAEEQVTLVGVLPAGKGFIWDGIPGSCALPDSTLSADKKTITCVKKDFDTNNVGSYAEDMAFAVKVEGDAVNGSVPGDIEFTIDTPNNIAAPTTDSTHTTNATDNDQIKITASPRWNIDKHGGAGYYTTQYGQTNPNTGETGYILWYNFTIEVDEVPGETENGGVTFKPSLGNEALLGGADATVTFTDDISAIAPNAVLADWSSTGCDMIHSNGDEPYASPNATYPDRSVSAPNGPLAVTCSQTGTNISVTVDHVDGTLTNAPIKNRNGGLLSVKRKIAAIGTLKVFIPLSDVENGEDGINGNGDDGELTTTNCLKDFTPKGVSGGDNFNGLEESEADNCRDITLYASRGSWSKSYRKGWGDTATQQAQWGGGYWASAPTDASIVMAGDGTANPGTLWGTYNYYGNSGGTDIDNPMICDVIDINTFEMVILDTVDDPGTAIDDTKHAVDINHGWTETLPGITVQYAIGYVGSWPPDPDVAPGDKVAKECNATSITWYDDYVQAKAAADAAGTAVSKARMFADKIPPSQYMSMRIKHKARANYFGTNTPIPNKTVLANYAVYKSSLTSDKYINNSYRPHDADTPHQGGYQGDRLIMQRAKVRILKDMQPTAVSPGSEPTVTLTPSFTVDGPNPQTDTVVIADLLPKGLEYKSGTTTGTYGAGATPYGEPTVYAPASDAECNQYAAAIVAEGKPCGTLNGGTGEESILVWDLGTQTTGTVYEDIKFTTIVSIDAPHATLSNYAQIESPADDSAPVKRMSNANVSNSVPSSLLIVKSVQTPLHEINKGSLLNWMKFNVGVRNGSAVALSELDMIDILPFNGDGVLGSFTFTPASGTTIDRNRAPATNFSGTFEFDSMSFDENGECNASAITYWFTNDAGPLDISPVASSNTDNAGNPTAIWCAGTVSGPDVGCGFTKSEVTAVRIRDVNMSASGTCFLNLTYATQDNVHDDIYSNTAGAKANGVTNGVLSNTVSAQVYGSSIGDKVWFDKNKDGIQANNASEPGISGVTVNLLDGAGTLVATTTTDVNGTYNFPNLIHGDYVVEVVPPAGYLVTGKDQGGDDTLDSDIDTVTHKTDTITLGQNASTINVDAGLHAPVISGNIFDDGNGDGNVNGTAISTPDGTQLHATLLNNAGVAIATIPIAADGSYSFDGGDGVRANSDYSVVLATTANATTSNLPINWNNTGENINSAGAGNDGSSNGVIAVSVGTADVPQVDFGINKKPVAVDVTEPSQLNPGGSTQVQVPDLNVSDLEDGTPTTVTIKTLPGNATLYYDGVEITDANHTIANFDPSKLKVDPDDGDQTVVFDYTTTDAAGVESDPATVTMPFTGLRISGNIFDDGNGDGNVNGTAISSPDGTQLHATLLDASGTVLATTPIAADGSYSFDGADGIVPNTDYSVVLATTASATTPNLPVNWNNTGENINSAGAGNDGAANGLIAVSVGTANVPQVDFGINKKPVAVDVTEPSQLNPGGAVQVAVPDLNVSDLEDGTPTTVTIETLPTNATLYYDGVAVTAGQVIPNFDNTKLTVDPIDGDQTVVFDYTTTDAAGVKSDPATVTMPFTGLGISGNVFNDGDGDADVNGAPIPKPDGTQLHATLLAADGVTVVATTPIGADGSYSFTGADGVTANISYTVVLATTPSATASDLPTNWNNTGENINSAGAGNDGTADGTISVTLGTVTIPQIDFGINKKPVASDVSKPIQNNPGGNTQVPVPALQVSDNEDGTPTTVTIKTLPTSGTLYYNGVAVTPGQVIPNFNPSKLTVDPNNGNVVITFDYTTTDAAGIESDPATVTMPFNGAGVITGNVSAQDSSGNLKPIANVTLVLYNPNGTEVARTTTDANGNYRFSVPPGNYYIQEAQPSGYYDVSEDEGGADNETHNALLNTINVTVGVGETDIKNDFVESTYPSACAGCTPNPVIPCGICTHGFYVAHTHNLKDNSTEIHWLDSYYEIAYDIYLNGKFIATVGEDKTRYTLKGLQSGTEYTAVIIANNGYGGKTRQTVKFKTTDSLGWLPAIYHMLN